MKLLALLKELFGQGYLNKMIGTKTNIAKPIKMDKNSPYKLYSDKAFEDPDLLFKIEKKLEEYGPYVLSNKNSQEVANFEMNVRRALNAKKPKESQVKKAAEAMFGPLGKPKKPEADIVDIRTKEKLDDEGIMKLKKELEELKASEEGLALKDVKPTKMSEQGAKAYSANIESYRRPIIRQMLLKDTRINLSDDVRDSLLMKKDLQRGADPEMDPLRLLNEYYDVDFNKLDQLEEIRFTAGNEFEAADEFLEKGGLKPKSKVEEEIFTDERPPKDPEFKSGGRVSYADGGLNYLMGV